MRLVAILVLVIMNFASMAAFAESTNPFARFEGTYTVISETCTENGQAAKADQEPGDQLKIEEKFDATEMSVWLTKMNDAGETSHNLAPYPQYPWLSVNGFSVGENFVELRIFGEEIFSRDKPTLDLRTRITKNDDGTFSLLESTVRQDKSGALLFSWICNTEFK